jgi:hypothetical protein
VCSARVKDFLEAEKVAHLEFLPVTILNHKGRKERAPYFVVNTLGTVDCIDLKKTRWKQHLISPSDIDEVENLTLDESRIDPSRALFRLAKYSVPVVFRADLADKILRAGFTGIRFMDPHEFRF